VLEYGATAVDRHGRLLAVHITTPGSLRGYVYLQRPSCNAWWWNWKRNCIRCHGLCWQGRHYRALPAYVT